VTETAAAYRAAWNTGSPDAVASFYAQDGEIVINRGTPWQERSSVGKMAARFYADVTDLVLACNDVRIAGDHVAFFWTFTGSDCGTGNPLTVVGWAEWDLGADYKVTVLRGWFHAYEHARQVNAD
jgi:hypothetical protein